VTTARPCNPRGDEMPEQKTVVRRMFDEIINADNIDLTASRW
jgi:hypothetical protein